MHQEEKRTDRKGIISYSKDFERRIFFYATIIMFLLYCFLKFFGG